MRRPSGTRDGGACALSGAAGDAFTARIGRAGGGAADTAASSLFFTLRLRSGATARVTIPHSTRSSSESERLFLMATGADAAPEQAHLMASVMARPHSRPPLRPSAPLRDAAREAALPCQPRKDRARAASAS